MNLRQESYAVLCVYVLYGMVMGGVEWGNEEFVIVGKNLKREHSLTCSMIKIQSKISIFLLESIVWKICLFSFFSLLGKLMHFPQLSSSWELFY